MGPFGNRGSPVSGAKKGAQGLTCMGSVPMCAQIRGVGAGDWGRAMLALWRYVRTSVCWLSRGGCHVGWVMLSCVQKLQSE